MFNDFRIGWKKGLVALAIIALFIWHWITKSKDIEGMEDAWEYYAEMFGWNSNCRTVLLDPKDNVKRTTARTKNIIGIEAYQEIEVQNLGWDKWVAKKAPFVKSGIAWQIIIKNPKDKWSIQYLWDTYVRGLPNQMWIQIADFKVKDCANDWSNVSEIQIILPKIPVNG